MRTPDAPSGWPIAIAPPLTLTLLRVELRPARQAGERLRGERLVELDDLDVAPADARPARARGSAASTGRDAEHVGVDGVRRRGRRSARAARGPTAAPAASSPMQQRAGAVVERRRVARRHRAVLRERRLELARASRRDVSGADALVARELACRAPGRPSRRRSRRPRPRRRAGGCAPRTRPAPRARCRGCPASFSVLSPSEIVHCSGISGLTMRQPSVVECSVCVRRARKPRSGLSSTHGARLIDSTPPTSTSDGVAGLDRAAGLHRGVEATSRTGG